MVLTSLLCLAAAASAMPLNTYNQATHYPVKRQFTFTPIPVNDPTSTPSPAESNQYLYDSSSLPQVNPIVFPVSDNTDSNVQSEPATAEHPGEQQNDSIQLQPVETLPEDVINSENVQQDAAVERATSEVVNDAEGSGEPVQENIVADPLNAENASNDAVLTVTTLNQTVVETTTVQVQNATEPVMRDEQILVQVPEQVNVATDEAAATESVTDTTSMSPEPFTLIELIPVTPSLLPMNEGEVFSGAVVESSMMEGSGIEDTPAVLVNEAPVESVAETTVADASSVAPEDQPQLDFVDSTSFGNSDVAPTENNSRTAYQYLNLTDSSAQNLVVNISLPSMTTSDLISKLQYRTTKLNYTSKLDVALQLTALAHNLMTSVDDQLGVMNL